MGTYKRPYEVDGVPDRELAICSGSSDHHVVQTPTAVKVSAKCTNQHRHQPFPQTRHSANKRAARSLRATVVTLESGDTRRKAVDRGTLLLRWMRRRLLNLQNSNASSSTNRVTLPSPRLSSTGNAQSTVVKISTLMEDHAQSGWLCELVTEVDDTRLRENESVELLVDTGATEHVCGSPLHTRCVDVRSTSSAQDRYW